MTQDTPGPSPYDLMPELRRVHIFSKVLDRIENRADSKAIAAWVALLGGGSVVLGGFLTTAYRAINSSNVSEFTKTYPNVTLLFYGSVATLFAIFGARWILKLRENRLMIEADTASDFKIIQMVFLAHIKSPEKVDFVNRYWVESRDGDARYFDMNFGWTSDANTLVVKVRNKKFQHRIEDGHKFGQNKLIIDLGTPLKAGHREVIDFCFETNTTGHKPGAPYISLTIPSPKFPRFNTFLGVVAAPGVDIANLYREQFFSFLADRPIRREPVHLSKDRRHFWPISTKPGWRACLSWTFGG